MKIQFKNCMKFNNLVDGAVMNTLTDDILANSTEFKSWDYDVASDILTIEAESINTDNLLKYGVLLEGVEQYL